ncbi:MAG: hemolysin family protein [Muribaculaceae bacterium]|nr:hemolysin family protein [Muribaculaceae bacterium]
MTTWLIISGISLVLSALFSGTEIAFITSDRVRMELDVKHGGVIGRIINKFYNQTDFFISSILVGNNVMLVVYGMGAAALLEPWLQTMLQSEWMVLISQTLISTAVILLVGEFLPKTIFRINPNSSLKIFAIPIYFFYLLFYPISLFATWLSNALMRLFGVHTQNTRIRMLSVGDLNEYLEETIDILEEKQETVEKEVKIFQNALDFSTTRLRDCMTPRNEIAAVDIDDTTIDELSKLFTSTGRSKILVYKGDIDNILGYIHVSELFDRAVDWKKKIKEVAYAPETILAKKMMRRLLQEKRSIVIVVDEFGGVAGLVTLEDLVEEIFGDIQDEHDKQKLMMRTVEPGVYEISGRCEIERINETLDLDIPESDEYQTIAGYIMASTGTIPDEGQWVELGGLRLQVKKKSDKRLELIKVVDVSAAATQSQH